VQRYIFFLLIQVLF